MLTYPGMTTTPGSTKAPYRTVPGGTTRTPAEARSFLVGILSLYSKGPASIVRISAIPKYRLMAFITHALGRHSPSLFWATRSSPLSRAATASKTAARYSSDSSSPLSSNAASILSCISLSSSDSARLQHAHQDSRRSDPRGSRFWSNRSVPLASLDRLSASDDQLPRQEPACSWVLSRTSSRRISCTASHFYATPQI